MMTATDPLQELFSVRLPKLLAEQELDARIASGQLMVVTLSKDGTRRGWVLHALPNQSHGGQFIACAVATDVACRIEMQEVDLLAVGAGTLHPQMALMSGKIKVAGDLDCAMALGALLA